MARLGVAAALNKSVRRRIEVAIDFSRFTKNTRTNLAKAIKYQSNDVTSSYAGWGTRVNAALELLQQDGISTSQFLSGHVNRYASVQEWRELEAYAALLNVALRPNHGVYTTDRRLTGAELEEARANVQRVKEKMCGFLDKNAPGLVNQHRDLLNIIANGNTYTFNTED